MTDIPINKLAGYAPTPTAITHALAASFYPMRESCDTCERPSTDHTLARLAEQPTNQPPKQAGEVPMNDTPKFNHDPVRHPAHYANSTIECIEAMKAASTPEQFQGYLRLNAFKYQWRYDKKGKALEDLQKAEWYLNLLIYEIRTQAQGGKQDA